MTKQIRTDLIWGGGIIALALAATAARQLDFIDADTATRIVLCATGLMVAAYGNRLPKEVLHSAQARQARRVAGWSLALSGLVYAFLWVVAPTNVALIGGCGAIIIGIVVTMLYCRKLKTRETMI